MKRLEIDKLFFIMKLTQLLPIVCLLVVFGTYVYCQLFSLRRWIATGAFEPIQLDPTIRKPHLVRII